MSMLADMTTQNLDAQLARLASALLSLTNKQSVSMNTRNPSTRLRGAGPVGIGRISHQFAPLSLLRLLAIPELQ